MVQGTALITSGSFCGWGCVTAVVHAFHAAALAQGGKDAGAPGARPQYTAGFYGAFAYDPEGFKIEAVVREALPG